MAKMYVIFGNQHCLEVKLPAFRYKRTAGIRDIWVGPLTTKNSRLKFDTLTEDLGIHLFLGCNFAEDGSSWF